MNLEEAKTWLEQMGPEKAAVIVHEHYHLKQHLCSQILQVPTGSPDWVKRSITKCAKLKEFEHQFRVLTNTVGTALHDAIHKTKSRECSNCSGTGRVGNDSCVVCRGTGASAY